MMRFLCCVSLALQHVRILQVYALSRIIAHYAETAVAASSCVSLAASLVSPASAAAAAAAAKNPSVILCGDLNCDHASGGHFLLRNARIPSDHVDWSEGLINPKP